MRLFASHAKRYYALGLAAASSCLGLGVAMAEPKPRTAVAIVASPMEPLASGVANQTLIKKWTVVKDHQNHSSSCKVPALQLAVSVPSLIFVRRDRKLAQVPLNAQHASAVARVEFSGDNKQLLDAIEVTTHNKKKKKQKTMLQVDLQSTTSMEGFLMGEIFLAPGVPLTALSLRGDIALVIQDDEVFPDVQQDDAMSPSFKMNLLGAVKVFLSLPQHRRLRFESLKINSLGDNLVQVDTPALQIDKKLKINSKGNCDVDVRSQSLHVNGSVTTNLMGDGQVRVAASSLQVAKDLHVKIWGNAKVYFGGKQHESSCHKAKLASHGDGHIDLGALKCEKASVKLRGDADVVLQVTDKLKVHATPLAKVQIVGKLPAKVDAQGNHHHKCRAFTRHQNGVVEPALKYVAEEDPGAGHNNPLKALPEAVPIHVCAVEKSN